MTGSTAAMAPRDLYFVMLPRVNLLDFAGIAECFRLANGHGGAFRLHYVGPRRSVGTTFALTLGGVRPLPKTIPEDAIVVTLGARRSIDDHASPEAHAAVQWLAQRARPGHLLCGVCTGAFLLARAGLLDGRPCTTHHAHTARLQAECPRVRVLENRVFVQDGNVFTTAGITAGVDLGLHLVSELVGPLAAAAVAREMVVYMRRSADDPQLSPWLMHRNHLHPAVHRVQDAVAKDPTQAWTVEAMAARAHTSARHLARLFKEHAGTNPLDYLQRIRVARAKQLLQHERWPLERVAEAAGFSSAHQLRRVWKKLEPSTPGAMRSAPARLP